MSQTKPISSKSREVLLKEELPARTKQAITDTLKKVKTVFISPKPPLTELPNADDVLNPVKHQLYKVIISKEFNSSIEDLMECFNGVIRSRKEYAYVKSNLEELQKFVDDSKKELDNLEESPAIYRIVENYEGDRTIVATNINGFDSLLTTLTESKLWEWAKDADPEYEEPDFSDMFNVEMLNNYLRPINISWSYFSITVEQLLKNEWETVAG